METVMFSAILTIYNFVQQVLVKIRTVAAELPHSDSQVGRRKDKYDEADILVAVFDGRI
jgi:hypothetical protein